MREQHVAFRLRAAVIDHHIYDVAALYCDFAAGSLKLLDRYEAFAFIAEVDDSFLGVYTEHGPLQDLVARRRRKMRVVLEEMLVFLEIVLSLRVVVYRHRASSPITDLPVIVLPRLRKGTE